MLINLNQIDFGENKAIVFHKCLLFCHVHLFMLLLLLLLLFIVFLSIITQ